MRFVGHIHRVAVQILHDSGSYDNFLRPKIGKFIKLPIQLSPHFRVVVGNGDTLTVKSFIVYLLPVSGADLVLGASWLATIGIHVVDYVNMNLWFYWGHRLIALHGLMSIHYKLNFTISEGYLTRTLL